MLLASASSLACLELDLVALTRGGRMPTIKHPFAFLINVILFDVEVNFEYLQQGEDWARFEGFLMHHLTADEEKAAVRAVGNNKQQRDALFPPRRDARAINAQLTAEYQLPLGPGDAYQTPPIACSWPVKK